MIVYFERGSTIMFSAKLIDTMVKPPNYQHQYIWRGNNGIMAIVYVANLDTSVICPPPLLCSVCTLNTAILIILFLAMVHSHTQRRVQPDQCYIRIQITGINFECSLLCNSTVIACIALLLHII